MSEGGKGNNSNNGQKQYYCTTPHCHASTIICMQYDYFCIICSSQSSVDEDSSLLVYCTKLIGKILLVLDKHAAPI